MPLTSEQWKRYPKNWQQIRKDILHREKHCCKFCGVPNYAVGHRDITGKFFPVRGNSYLDNAGHGKLHYKEARFVADLSNLWSNKKKYIVIILTVAHLDHTPENNGYGNLAALCQRCHLNHDRKDNLHRKRKNARRRRAIRDLFE